jgi:hypothetical protein
MGPVQKIQSTSEIPDFRTFYQQKLLASIAPQMAMLYAGGVTQMEDSENK